MGGEALIALMAMAGGLATVAVREALISAPRLASWLRASIAPLRRASREGYAPSADEQRRLALLGSGAIAATALLIAGPGPLAVAGAAGPWCVGALVAADVSATGARRGAVRPRHRGCDR